MRRYSRCLSLSLWVVFMIVWGKGFGLAATQSETLKVAYFPGAISVPINVMETQKLPQKFGINVDFKRFADPEATNLAWIHGEVQLQPGMNLNQSAANFLRSGYGLAVFPTFVATNKVLVRTDSGIAQLSDLRGKRVGIPSRTSGESVVLRWLLEEAGVGWEREVEVREIPPNVLPGMLQRTQVDAIVLFEPFSSRAIDEGGGGVKLLSDLQAEWQKRKGFPLMFSAIHVDGNFARKNPEVVKKYLAMYKEAVEYIEKNPDSVYGFYRGLFKFTPEGFNLLKKNLRGIYPLEWNDKMIAGMKDYLSLAVRYGLLPRVPDEMFSREFAP
ncbi:MAG TPA: ABC transporter substrate-binding protein [bacterium]|nr:ABC transporter substrate-binding protein [bacterium]